MDTTSLYCLIYIPISYILLRSLVRKDKIEYGQVYSYKDVYGILIISLLFGWLIAPCLLLICLFILIKDITKKPPNWL